MHSGIACHPLRRRNDGGHRGRRRINDDVGGWRSFSRLCIHRLRMFSIIVPYRHLLISFYYTHSIMHDNSLFVAVGGLDCDLLTSSDLHFYSLCSFQTTLQEWFETAIENLGKSRKGFLERRMPFFKRKDSKDSSNTNNGNGVPQNGSNGEKINYKSRLEHKMYLVSCTHR